MNLMPYEIGMWHQDILIDFPSTAASKAVNLLALNMLAIIPITRLARSSTIFWALDQCATLTMT